LTLALNTAYSFIQDFMPAELKGKRFLQPEDSIEDKEVNWAALREWEWKHQGGQPWAGRAELERKVREKESDGSS
jgi:hypothetical protein